MPIHMGITCEQCRNIHFIATSSAIQFIRQRGIYQLNCLPPCGRMHEFQKHDMRPYRVTDDVFRRGYAEEGEYEPVPCTERATPRYLAAHG